MSMPVEVIADVDSRVLSTIHYFQCVPVELVVSLSLEVFARLIRSTLHISGWNCIFNNFSHFSTASRSSCSLMAAASDLTSLYTRQSSVKRRESEWLTSSGRSYM